MQLEERGVILRASIPLSLSPKSRKLPYLRMAGPGGRPPGPEPGFRLFCNLGRKREGEVFCFQRLAKAFIGADSKNLKMRRLPPTISGMNESEIKIRELELKEAEQQERLRFDREHAMREFEMREKELKRKRWDVITPVLVAIIGALLGIWANITASSKKNEDLQRMRTEAELTLQKQKARSDLVLELIRTGNPRAAHDNIKTFLELGLLDDPDGKIAAFISRTEPIPTLPDIRSNRKRDAR